MVRFSADAGNFYLHHRVQTGSGACPASYPMVTGGCFSGGKAAEDNNAWYYTSTPPYVFMVWRLVKHRDNFAFICVCVSIALSTASQGTSSFVTDISVSPRPETCTC